MATFLKTALSPGRKLQFIATSDIGHFAAQAFQNPKDPAYCNTAINLAGDEISFQDMNDVFRDTQGHDTPTTWSLLARLALWFLKEINVMFSWFEKEGFKADVEELRRLHPKLKSFRDWLQSESGWAANK